MQHPIDDKRTSAESTAEAACFATDPAPSAGKSPTAPSRLRADWANDHLAQYADDETRAANLRRQETQRVTERKARTRKAIKRTLIGATILALLAGGGLAIADYLGWHRIGLFPDHEPETVPDTAAKPQEAAPAPPVDTLKLARDRDRAAHLRNGIAMMRRDLAEVVPKAANADAAMRSAAATVEQISAIIRANPQLGAVQLIELQHRRAAAQADCNNAQRRLSDLNDEKSSLEHRIAKAQTELDGLTL